MVVDRFTRFSNCPFQESLKLRHSLDNIKHASQVLYQGSPTPSLVIEQERRGKSDMPPVAQQVGEGRKRVSAPTNVIFSHCWGQRDEEILCFVFPSLGWAFFFFYQDGERHHLLPSFNRLKKATRCCSKMYKTRGCTKDSSKSLMRTLTLMASRARGKGVLYQSALTIVFLESGGGTRATNIGCVHQQQSKGGALSTRNDNKPLFNQDFQNQLQLRQASRRHIYTNNN